MYCCFVFYLQKSYTGIFKKKRSTRDFKKIYFKTKSSSLKTHLKGSGSKYQSWSLISKRHCISSSYTLFLVIFFLLSKES